MLYQLGALDAFAQVAGAEVAYVKPHGALYHATVDGRARPTPSSPPPPSTTRRCRARCARLGAAAPRDAAGLEPVVEAFADRAYLRDGTLVPRSEPDALVLDPAEVAARAVRLAVDHEVLSVDGTVVKVAVRSLCVHGDTPGAVGLAHAVRDALDAAGIGVHPFSREDCA